MERRKLVHSSDTWSLCSPLAGESSQGCPDRHPHGDGVVPSGQHKLPDGHDARWVDVIQRGGSDLGVRFVMSQNDKELVSTDAMDERHSRHHGFTVNALWSAVIKCWAGGAGSCPWQRRCLRSGRSTGPSSAGAVCASWRRGKDTWWAPSSTETFDHTSASLGSVLHDTIWLVLVVEIVVVMIMMMVVVVVMLVVMMLVVLRMMMCRLLNNNNNSCKNALLFLFFLCFIARYSRHGPCPQTDALTCSDLHYSRLPPCADSRGLPIYSQLLQVTSRSDRPKCIDS